MQIIQARNCIRKVLTGWETRRSVPSRDRRPKAIRACKWPGAKDKAGMYRHSTHSTEGERARGGRWSPVREGEKERYGVRVGRGARGDRLMYSRMVPAASAL